MNTYNNKYGLYFKRLFILIVNINIWTPYLMKNTNKKLVGTTLVALNGSY